MQRSRPLLTALMALGVLAGSIGNVVAQDGGTTSDAPALATGQRFHTSVIDFTDISESDGALTERGRILVGRSEMSDPRLSGELVLRDNADRWSEGGTFLGDVLWGTVEITNDGGTWAGTSVGTTDTTADGAGITYYELVGIGGYEGMSAIIFEREAWDQETRTGEWFLNGVIFPGPLPPGR